jgi:hypothetical protein
MYCDRSAYYQKAIKATARRFKNNYELAVAFFAFWAINHYFKVIPIFDDERNAHCLNNDVTIFLFS